MLNYFQWVLITNNLYINKIMALPVAAIQGGAGFLGGAVQAIFGGAAKRQARKRRLALEDQLSELEQNRQAIIDPYA